MYTAEIHHLKTALTIANADKNKLQVNLILIRFLNIYFYYKIKERFDAVKNNVKYLKKNNKYVNKMVKNVKYDLDY